MDFSQTYEAFMHFHIAQRNGERKGRLQTRNFHAEKLFLENVWWLLKGNLDDLHPEYEIMDWRSRSYFADFAWLPEGGTTKWLIEIKGYNSHVRDMDRQGYCNELNRELFLQSLGYRIISFAYDDVANRGDVCVLLLRMLFSRYEPSSSHQPLVRLAETEIVRLASSQVKPVRPLDVKRHLNINYRSANRYLTNLVSNGWLKPIPGASGKRTIGYRLTQQAMNYFD
ncbi:hypothetical protein A8990_1554 [Paenibacillus taihuensis]|uniref:DUF559 domain-containing protein n=1 Tax=Paenibacillus taihuensis TaxID=1156355 RepID=A0A3D9Q6Y7_9BACL|nr:hypothetical protein [Paenibacillus taihuensis]REE57426.1 hypothetical protein A8990_1554 [Paenibacillus taihuensis]